MNNHFLKRIKSVKSETWLIAGLMLIAAVAHAWNMFHFPYFENDEATYVSQAWAFIHTGKLAPYTYYYDHAPAGWMFLGIWFWLTGGLTTFGQNPLISGRIFIFILHMASVLLLYIITKRVTRQKLAATLAVIIFSLSPLELYFGRRVLLDNIMVFWMLLSLFFATATPQRLRSVIFSAITFAIAALSKENALFIGPVILYITWLYTPKRIRAWAVSQWIVVSVVIMSLYPLYAILKGEFFPAGSFLGGTKAHVSLIATTLDQSSRGIFAFPWEKQSDFYANLMEWLTRDPFIIIAGAVCLLASMILNERYREIKAISLTAIAELLFLARGKLVIDYYILAVLPLLSITIGIMLSRPVVWAKNHISPKGYSITICFIIALIFLSSGNPAFSRDETTNQQDAITWIEHHVPKNAYIAIDNYAYPQLHDVDGYVNADYDFKIQYDPAITVGKYENNQNKIQYLLITHEEIVQMHAGNLPFIEDAFNHSQEVADYTKNSTSYIDINQLISTNGDWAQVYKTDPENAGLLVEEWRSYKSNFIKSTGQVIDPQNGNSTSEAQAYALSRSLTLNDRVEFDRVWQWTQENLQVRNSDKLLASKVQIDTQGDNYLADVNPSPGADEDIAFSLYQAYKKWGDKTYLNNAKSIIKDIWKKEVVSRNNSLYLVSVPDNQFENQLLVNPSYLAPNEYKLFAQLDPQDKWGKLVSDSYKLLQNVQKQSKVGLFSNWIAISQNGSLTSADHLTSDSPDTFGDEAFRVGYRMASDISDPRAKSILSQLNAFYESQWTTNHLISSQYDLNGNPLSNYSDVPSSAGAVISLHAMNQSLAYTIYRDEITTNFYTDGMYWGESSDYYSQNWGAIAVAYLKVGGVNTKGDIYPNIASDRSIAEK